MTDGPRVKEQLLRLTLKSSWWQWWNRYQRREEAWFLHL